VLNESFPGGSAVPDGACGAAQRSDQANKGSGTVMGVPEGQRGLLSGMIEAAGIGDRLVCNHCSQIESIANRAMRRVCGTVPYILYLYDDFRGAGSGRQRHAGRLVRWFP
jgi:hypothetical protein